MDALWMSNFLLLCAAANYGMLLLSFVGFVLARGLMYRLHRRWFALSDERLDTICYQFFGLYKLGIWFVLLIPGLVLRFVA